MIGAGQCADTVDRAGLQPPLDCGLAVSDAPLTELDKGWSAAVGAMSLQTGKGHTEPSGKLLFVENRICELVSHRTLLWAANGSEVVTDA